jgi:hypothetical protein
LVEMSLVSNRPFLPTRSFLQVQVGD